MKTRWALRFLFFLVGTYLAVGMVLRTEWAGARICDQGAGIVSRLLGQPIVLSRCAFDPWRTEVTIEGIRLGAEAEAFRAKKLEVRFSLFSIARGFSISRVTLDSPRLVLDLRAEGEEEAAPTERRASCLGPLEDLPLGEAVLRNASLSLHLPRGQALHLRGVDVDAQSEGRSRKLRIEVAGGSFEPGDREAIELGLREALVTILPGEERLEIESFELEALDSTLRVKGRVEELCAPRLALRGNIRADLERLGGYFLPDAENVGGKLSLGAALNGPLGDLRAQANLQLRDLTIDEMEPGDLTANLVVEGGRLEIEDLVWPVGEGRARVEGAVELGGRMYATLGVRTEGLPFHRMMARLPVKNTPVMMQIDSTHRLRGPLLGGLALEGTSRLHIHGFNVRNEPWHAADGISVVEVPGTALLEGGVRITEDGVHLSGGHAAFGRETRLELDARLFFEEAKGMQILARSESFDLGDVAGHVAEIPMAGRGVLEASIRGPYPDPLIEGTIEFSDARLWSGRLGRVRAKVDSRPSAYGLHFSEVEGRLEETGYRGEVDLVLGDEATIDGELSLDSGGRLGEVWGATRELLSPLDWLADNLDGRVDAVRARFRGALPDLQAEAWLRTRSTRLMDRPFDALEAKILLPDLSALRVEELRLSRAGGVAEIGGEVRFPEGETPRVRATLDAEGLPIRDLLGEFGEWAELEGVVGSEATLAGPIDGLDLRGDLRGTALGAAGVPLEDTHLSLETQGDQVIVRGALVGAGTLAAAVRLAEELPFDASLFLDVPRLASFLPEGAGIEGRVRGQAVATGTLADVAAASGNITLDELVLGLAGYRVESRREVSLGFSGPAFVLYGLDLEGENTSLSLHGNRSIEDVLDLQAQGSFDARLVGTFLPELEHPSGVISMKASITGTGERPIVVGSAEIERGSFRHRDLPVSIHSLGARLAFSQNQLVVQEAAMQLNGGPARLSGTVSLKGVSPDVLDLVLQARDLSWRMPAEWPVVASGRIGITGPWGERVVLSGEATIERLRWLQDLDIEKMILDVRRNAQAPPPTDSTEWVRLDLDLIGGDDMRVDTEHLRARLRFVGGQGRDRGRLRLVGSNLNPTLLGSVEVLDGVALFRGNEYRVTNGMVDFRERDRLDPAFDITAETEVREYRIAAHAYGRLEDFQVDLRSEPLLAQADILTLLTFGITSQDLDAGGGATAFSGASLAADALLTVSGFDEHVKRWLPQTPLLMDPDISVTSQFSELTGQMEPMAVFEAKVFTDRLKLQAATPFATTKGRRASAEVRVSDRLSSQLSWQNEAVGYSSGDLGFDLKLRWEWE